MTDSDLPLQPPDHAALIRAERVAAFHGIIGRSEAMRRVYEKIELYGPADAPVLITGETGTGKELIARALHNRSPRFGRSFVALNCTALNEELFESELFGHEKGSFTGATRAHRGRFERADGGTLFLDEIGDMSLRVQAKMLRALEEGIIERVGSEQERQVDVRILAATNTPLDQAVQFRRFRADLFHRVSVFRIHAPPLREREGDLPLIAAHFLEILNERYGRRVTRLTPEAVRLLEDYSWPGNVRELRNVLERVYVESRAEVIGRNHFAEWERERDSHVAGGWGLPSLEQERLSGRVIIVPAGGILYTGTGFESGDGDPAHPLAPMGLTPLALTGPGAPMGAPGAIDVPYIVERPGRIKADSLTAEAIREAFARAGGNVTRAAQALGCHKTTLYRNMKRLGLSREEMERQGMQEE